MTTHFEGDDCEPDGHRAEMERLRASAPLFPGPSADEAIPSTPSTSSRSDATPPMRLDVANGHAEATDRLVVEQAEQLRAAEARIAELEVDLDHADMKNDSLAADNTRLREERDAMRDERDELRMACGPLRALEEAVRAYDKQLRDEKCSKHGPYDCDIAVGQSFPFEWPKIVAALTPKAEG